MKNHRGTQNTGPGIPDRDAFLKGYKIFMLQYLMKIGPWIFRSFDPQKFFFWSWTRTPCVIRSVKIQDFLILVLCAEILKFQIMIAFDMWHIFKLMPMMNLDWMWQMPLGLVFWLWSFFKWSFFSSLLMLYANSIFISGIIEGFTSCLWWFTLCYVAGKDPNPEYIWNLLKTNRRRCPVPQILIIS